MMSRTVIGLATAVMVCGGPLTTFTVAGSYARKADAGKDIVDTAVSAGSSNTLVKAVEAVLPR